MAFITKATKYTIPATWTSFSSILTSLGSALSATALYNITGNDAFEYIDCTGAAPDESITGNGTVPAGMILEYTVDSGTLYLRAKNSAQVVIQNNE